MPPLSSLCTLLDQGNFPLLLDQLSGRLTVSAVSKRNILSGWRLYIQWLEQEGGSLTNADAAQASAYAAWLQATYSAPATLNNRLAQVRKLYRLLQAEELTADNPFEELHGLVNPAHERRPFYSPEEVQRLLARASLENQLLVLLGAHAGLTGPEVVALTYEYCQPEVLQVGERLIEPTPELKQVLAQWRMEQGERPLLTPELAGRVFTLRDDQELRARIWQLCQQANVDYRGWYALRNAAGLQMLTQRGARAAEQQLGLGGRAALHPTSRLVGKKKKEIRAEKEE